MKSLGVKILGILVVAIMMLQSIVMAAPSTQGLENEKNANDKKINEAKSNLEEVKEQKSETVKQVENLASQIDQYETQIDQLNTQISDLNGKIESSKKDLEKAQEDYSKQEELLEARLVATYEAGDTSYLDVLLSSESITDLISNYYLVTEVATNDAELLDKIQKQKESIEKKKQELESNKKELDTSKASKQSVSTQLQTAKAEKNKQVAQLTEDEKKLQERIDELAQANRSIDAKIQEAIKKAQEEANKKPSGGNGNNGGNAGNGGGPSGSSPSGFIHPVPSGYSKITTGLYYASGQYHGAVDYGSGGINGQPIYAVAEGTVILSERLQGSYGNYIIIMHYNGLFTLYAHGQDGSRTVSAGQTVKQGQQIMRVGNTGNSTGPHLHFEVRLSPGNYSNRVSPYKYLP